MKKTLMILVLICVIAGCKSKKIKLTDTDVINVVDFIEFFPDIKLPYQIDDSVLIRKETDSTTIGYKILTQFIPDTVISKQFEHDTKLKIYPLGKVSVKKYETYLFFKVVGSAKKAGFIAAFNNKNEFYSGDAAGCSRQGSINITGWINGQEIHRVTNCTEEKSERRVIRSKKCLHIECRSKKF
jgi:hypothetical protein